VPLQSEVLPTWVSVITDKEESFKVLARTDQTIYRKKVSRKKVSRGLR